MFRVFFLFMLRIFTCVWYINLHMFKLFSIYCCLKHRPLAAYGTSPFYLAMLFSERGCALL